MKALIDTEILKGDLILMFQRNYVKAKDIHEFESLITIDLCHRIIPAIEKKSRKNPDKVVGSVSRGRKPEPIMITTLP